MKLSKTSSVNPGDDEFFSFQLSLVSDTAVFLGRKAPAPSPEQNKARRRRINIIRPLTPFKDTITEGDVGSVEGAKLVIAMTRSSISSWKITQWGGFAHLDFQYVLLLLLAVYRSTGSDDPVGRVDTERNWEWKVLSSFKFLFADRSSPKIAKHSLRIHSMLR